MLRHNNTRIINYIGGNHFQVSFTFFRLFVIVIVPWIKTDDHEKITDRSPVSDSLKIHLLNHAVRVRKFHLKSSHCIIALSTQYFCKLFCAQPSPGQTQSCQPYLNVAWLSQHREDQGWMFVRNVLGELEISINQPDPSDQIKIFCPEFYIFSVS